MSCVIVWFNSDLRLTDHPALSDAAKSRDAVIPVFVWPGTSDDPWRPGAASRWWLYHSLKQLQQSLADMNSRLILRCGDAVDAIPELAKDVDARAVMWNRCEEPGRAKTQAEVRARLEEQGTGVAHFSASLLCDFESIRTSSGTPYRVFTPFYNACVEYGEPASPLPRPGELVQPTSWPTGVSLDALGLLPDVDWAGGLRSTWTPGEASARQRLEAFIDDDLMAYAESRDRPDLEATSRLSPHLRWGEISVAQIWHAVHEFAGDDGRTREARAAEPFVRQLYWREFAYHLLHHFPDTPTQPLDWRFNQFKWRTDDADLQRWQQGQTGYPIVDAAMRALWYEGWMHNRARMIVGSFLVKDLLLPWQMGAEWFWDTLVDADLANNTLGWQWVGGCGADAAPYFRVFNPVLQSRKFDPTGAYIRRWVPELAKLPTEMLHEPWRASEATLEDAGVRLGDTYPEPIVDHGDARKRALSAYEDVKKSK